jgi:hypothetical protein
MKLKRSLLTPQKKPTNSYETHKEPTDTRIPTSIPSKETYATQKKPTKETYETHKEPTDTRIPTSIPSKETCETQKKPTNSFLTVFFRVDATRHGFTPFRV